MPTSSEINELWHLSRVALAGTKDTGRWARMQYVQKELIKKYPNIPTKKLWLQIDEETKVIK